MSKKAEFARAFRMTITISLPGQIMPEYYRSIGCKKHRAWTSGGCVYVGEKRGRFRRVATIEVSDCGSLRALFESDAPAGCKVRDQQFSAVNGGSNVTRWFPYSDRLSLAELVDDRIRALSRLFIRGEPLPPA